MNIEAMLNRLPLASPNLLPTVFTLLVLAALTRFHMAQTHHMVVLHQCYFLYLENCFSSALPNSSPRSLHILIDIFLPQKIYYTFAE